MNVGRALALVFALSVALSALSGTLHPAVAQGAGADTPSGYALTPVSGETDDGMVPLFPRGLRFMRAGHSPFVPVFVAWAPSRRAPAASERIAVVPTARRTMPGPAIRQRAIPAGR